MKPDRRGLTILSIATVVATWLLLVIGGLVNPTGSSMACPDWYFIPTCNGQVIPADWSGGILYEHGHRMWASGVGLLTLVLGVWMWRRRDLGDTTRRLGLGAIALVALQGTLGGITVKLNLSWVVSTMHLVTAMIFFSVLIIITGRVLAAPAPPTARAVGPRALVVSAALLVAFQIALGGIVRHLGAGLVCGDDWLGCGPGTFWPAGGAGQIHMFHRVVGYSVALILLVVAGRAAWALQQDGRPSWPARIPAILVLVQVTLGLLTVASGRSLWIVTFHTAVAGLVLASLVALYLTLGPLGSPRRAREAGRAALQPTLAALHAEVSPVSVATPTAQAPARPALATLRDYVTLTKPSITRMCLLMTGAGLGLAPGHTSLGVVLGALAGTALAVGSANALNMWWERHTDRLMVRTRTRPLAEERISPAAALAFGLAVGAAGLLLLALTTNLLTTALGAIALASYVLVYTPLKYHTPLALVIGAVPGAMPPLMGWTAVTDRLDAPGLVLFGILLLWQMPHFLAISLFRKHDYARAGIRIVPVVRGDQVARRQAVAWATGLVPVSLLLTPLGVTGTLYLLVALMSGLAFLGFAITGLRTTTGPSWAYRFFIASLVYLPLLTLGFVLDRIV